MKCFAILHYPQLVVLLHELAVLQPNRICFDPLGRVISEDVTILICEQSCYFGPLVNDISNKRTRENLWKSHKEQERAQISSPGVYHTSWISSLSASPLDFLGLDNYPPCGILIERRAARLCVSKITPPSPSASWRPSSSHAATQSFARRSGSERTRPWRGVCLRTIVKLGGLIRLMHGNITFIISPLHCLRSSHL